MKISLEWLGDYIDWKTDDVGVIADRITEATAEVDEAEAQGALMKNCCVGVITALNKHPDADRLSVCTVKTDQGDKPIVCGGTNLRKGMKVAFAHVGARVRSPDGDLFELGKIKIRGQRSEGMICASVELGLEDMFPETPDQGKRPVIDLGDGDDDVGMPLREYLGIADTILHIDNHAITHRPDLFSHIGFARECVAMGIASWKKEPVFEPPVFTKDPLPFSMHVEDDALMPRYCSCVIDIEGLGETPDWMKKRLVATGWRPVNLPVDITNYVMMEVGVPLHSFDADDIKGDITMRRAKKGETIVTLDEKERELSEGALVLADDEGIFDLLGIMGGLRSSTTDKTKRLYLHSASLDPVSVRKAMIEMGHRTDAGTVYEKGVPHVITQQGFYRAAHLMCELLPGASVSSQLESKGDNGTASVVTVSMNRIRSYLGTDIDADRAKEILIALGFEASGSDEISVTPPRWRLRDISGAHDIIEEVARMYGYDSIPVTLPEASISPPERRFEMHRLRDSLKESSYMELVPFSFVSPDLLQSVGFDPDLAVEVENPIGEEMSLMQPSVLPRMLEHAADQYRNAHGPLRTFTIGNVFAADGDEHAEFGALHMESDGTNIKQTAFYQLKHEVSTALSDAGYAASFSASDAKAYHMHPGRTADIFVDDTVIGRMFEVHPRVAQAFELPRRTAVALINVSALRDKTVHVSTSHPLPQYPSVSYDVTVERSHRDHCEDLIAAMTGTSDMLENVEVIDAFDRKDGSFNLTLRFTYRSDEKTLTDDEAKAEHAKVMAAAGVEG